MTIKNTILISVFMLSANFILAGCGGCQINNKVEKNEKTSAFINKVPYGNSIVEGFVVASCNKCNFGKMRDKKCSMGIKIDKNVYNVVGHDGNHDDAHNNDGICNALRVAYVSGNIKKNTFYADNFELIYSPK